jgi:hypothetical protein
LDAFSQVTIQKSNSHNISDTSNARPAGATSVLVDDLTVNLMGTRKLQRFTFTLASVTLLFLTASVVLFVFVL